MSQTQLTSIIQSRHFPPEVLYDNNRAMQAKLYKPNFTTFIIVEFMLIHTHTHTSHPLQQPISNTPLPLAVPIVDAFAAIVNATEHIRADEDYADADEIAAIPTSDAATLREVFQTLFGWAIATASVPPPAPAPLPAPPTHTHSNHQQHTLHQQFPEFPSFPGGGVNGNGDNNDDDDDDESENGGGGGGGDNDDNNEDHANDDDIMDEGPNDNNNDNDDDDDMIDLPQSGIRMQ